MKCVPALSLAALLGVAFLGPAGAPDKHPVRLASRGRLDLMAEAAVGELTAGAVVQGDGQLSRMSWRPEAARPLGYTVDMPINHLGWSKITLRFTPAKSGDVTLILTGPWEEARKGLLYRQEVLWDDLRAEGARLEG